MNAPGPLAPALPTPLSAADIVCLYHARSKHRFGAYAAGPAMLDWDAQPAPFRHYEGAPALVLPLLEELDHADPLSIALAAPCSAAGDARPHRPFMPTLNSIGVLLQLALGITAWKSRGPDRWAVRATPSSGNLHPVEPWILSSGVRGLADGLHHYRAEDHTLECRALDAQTPARSPRLAIALSTAMWREAWKYGERGFRYCQLDVGHAAAAIGHAAQLLGWSHEAVKVGNAALAQRLGLDRDSDYPSARYPEVEREEAELLLALGVTPDTSPAADACALLATEPREWFGVASPLDPAPRYRWPLIQEVAAATRRPSCPPPDLRNDAAMPVRSVVVARQAWPARRSGADIILGRRSAQRYAASFRMSRDQFLSIVEILTCPALPGLDPAPPPLTAILFVHRVDTLEPGLYLLATSPRGVDHCGEPPFAALGAPVPGFAPDTGLHLLRRFEPVELQRLARSLHCHQDIAANACLAIGLVAPFQAAVAHDPASYRDLFRAAGAIGQALYLGAEAIGLRGTGIGCFFDDPVHKLLGIEGSDYQTLYHFTVGFPVEDARVETGPAYPAPRLAPQSVINAQEARP